MNNRFNAQFVSMIYVCKSVSERTRFTNTDRVLCLNDIDTLKLIHQTRSSLLSHSYRITFSARSAYDLYKYMPWQLEFNANFLCFLCFIYGTNNYERKGTTFAFIYAVLICSHIWIVMQIVRSAHSWNVFLKSYESSEFRALIPKGSQNINLNYLPNRAVRHWNRRKKLCDMGHDTKLIDLLSVSGAL